MSNDPPVGSLPVTDPDRSFSGGSVGYTDELWFLETIASRTIRGVKLYSSTFDRRVGSSLKKKKKHLHIEKHKLYLDSV